MTNNHHAQIRQTLSYGMPSMKGYQKKYNIMSKKRTLLARDCEVEKLMRYFKNIEYIKKYKIMDS